MASLVTRPALDDADKLILLPIDVGEIVRSESGKLLLQFSFDDVPDAFDLQGIHGMCD